MTALWREFLLLSVIATVQCDHHMPCPAEYNRWQYLDGVAENYLLCWKVDWSDESITFQATVATTGWLGLGISPTGQMPNSDVVIGWVKNSQAFLKDRFARERALPPIDAIQNVQLINGSESNGKTTLTFKRKLKACEPNDLSITEGTTQVIFSYNPNDPASETSIERHTVQGRASINLLSGTGNVAPATLEADRQSVDVRNPNVSVPSKPTTYQCTPFKLPQLQNETHIIQFAPIVQEGHEELVHHILIYQCTDAVLSVLGQSWDCDNWPQNVSEQVHRCRGATVITAWAVGGGPVTLPPKVGLPMSGATGVQYVLMETHYNNEKMKSNYVDSSGVRVVYTPTKRQYDGAIWEVGNVVDYSLLLPPGLNNIINENICPGECTEAGLPQNGINVFASMLHAHTVGKAIWVEHIRNGSKLPNIDQNLNYDFNFQDTVFLRNEVKVLPGDEIRVSCEYDTSDRKFNTLGGEGTNDEMCLAFLLVYPRPLGSVCLSKIPHTVIPNYYRQAANASYLTPLVNDSADLDTQDQQRKEAFRTIDFSSQASKDLYFNLYWNTKERLYFCATRLGDVLAGLVTLKDVATPDTPTSETPQCSTVVGTTGVVDTSGVVGTSGVVDTTGDTGPTSSGKFLSGSILVFFLYAVLAMMA